MLALQTRMNSSHVGVKPTLCFETKASVGNGTAVQQLLAWSSNVEHTVPGRNLASCRMVLLSSRVPGQSPWDGWRLLVCSGQGACPVSDPLSFLHLQVGCFELYQALRSGVPCEDAAVVTQALMSASECPFCRTVSAGCYCFLTGCLAHPSLLCWCLLWGLLLTSSQEGLEAWYFYIMVHKMLTVYLIFIFFNISLGCLQLTPTLTSEGLLWSSWKLVLNLTSVKIKEAAHLPMYFYVLEFCPTKRNAVVCTLDCAWKGFLI